MKNILLISLLTFIFCSISAQEVKIDLKDFTTNYTFYPKQITKPNSMQDGKYYTILEDNGSKISQYSFATGKKTKTIVEFNKLKNSTINSVFEYQFSDNETKMLVATSRNQIYRHSFTAKYYVIDLTRNEIEPLSEFDNEQVATFSPDGYKVAYVRDNNIYIKNLRFGTTNQITDDGEANKIKNGIPDWVYEEEFSFNRALEWSPDSEELAFMKFDESMVKEFSFPIYHNKGNPENLDELYPLIYSYKYPKAGEKNSKVSVHVFNLRHRTTKEMNIDLGSDLYIPRIKWTNENDKLAILTLNRNQNRLDLLIANPASAVCNVILTNRNEQFVSDDILDNIYFLNDNRHFIFVGELDGYTHIHLYTMAGQKLRQITKGSWDVTDYYGYDEKNRLFYFQAAAISPLQREVYSIRLDGTKMTKLSTREGTNSAWFSSNFEYYINKFSNIKTPPIYSIYNNKNRLLATIEDNKVLVSKLKSYNLPEKEFFKFTTSTGDELNGWIIKPKNSMAGEKYPTLMTQYSGPGSQQVLDKWSVDWSAYLAQNGYVVACVDGRGTGARGEAFLKQTYMQLGQLESDDQIETAKYLATLPFVDKSRIGIWGWSYGGYMTAMSMSKSDLFKVGIAVAPVVDWKFYDTVYTERFMRTPNENPVGYKNTSVLEMAQNLSGRLFLIHSTADDNVHLQNTYEYTNKLIEANKQFDMFIYPNRNHGIFGGNTREHLYQMKFDYLERNLKN